MKRYTIGIWATIASAVYFGCMPFFVKLICQNGGTEMSASFYRFFFSLPALFVYLKIRRISLKITLKEFLQIVLVTVLGYGGTGLLLFTSYGYIPTGMATTLHFMYPVFTIVGAIFFLKKKIKKEKIFCVLLCAFGIYCFYNGDANISLIGVILAGSSGITYAFYTLYLANSSLKKMDTFKLIFYLNIISSIMVFVVSNAMKEFTYNITETGFLVAFLFATATSFIGVFGYQVGVKLIGAETTTILSTFEPITSLIIGFLVYNETLGVKPVAGAVLIIVSAVIVARLKE